MALTPVEIRHIQLKRSLFGYRKAAVHRMMDDIADSFETSGGSDLSSSNG
jgi:DivIVA domain-containing protein